MEDYIAGEGNEISTKKYFSVASSSRFATASFSELRNGLICKCKTFNGQTIDGLTFEKSCPIDNISIAYPDVYFKAGNETFYIEAKCQEIFTDHRQVKLKSKYLHSSQFKEILRILNREGIFEGKDEFLKYNGKTLCAENFGVGGTIKYFDFKQFLCHLMGLMSTQRKDPCNFYYLFFKLENNEFADIYNELEAELCAVGRAFKPVFKKYNITFGYMFSSSFDTLKNPQIVKL